MIQKKQTKIHDVHVTKMLHAEAWQLIALCLVFCCGGALLYLSFGRLHNLIAMIYSFLIGLLTIRLVWRMVSLHSRNLSHAIVRLAAEKVQSSMPRLSISISNHVLWLVLMGYVVISVAFAISYHVTQTVPSAITFGDCYYFSLVTLATVGYGDLVPVGFGRVLVSGEVLIGLGYQVVVIGAAVNYFAKFEQDER